MKLALVGYGRMGRAVEAVAMERGHEVVARIGPGDRVDPDALSGAAVAVEFTRPTAAVDNVTRLARCGVSMVVGTTGWHDRLDEVRGVVEEAGVGLVHAPNYSVGVQVLFRLVRRLGRMVEALDEYDIHVHEAHHRHKVDAPSGTAQELAGILLETVGRKTSWCGTPIEGAVDPATLQVTSARVGELAGLHVVGVDGPDDRIELRHEARGRSGFARGAVTSAEWIRGRTGLFTFQDVLDDVLGEQDRD